MRTVANQNFSHRYRRNKGNMKLLVSARLLLGPTNDSAGTPGQATEGQVKNPRVTLNREQRKWGPPDNDKKGGITSGLGYTPEIAIKKRGEEQSECLILQNEAKWRGVHLPGPKKGGHRKKDW